MGFPVCYTEVFLPKLFLHILTILSFIRTLIISLFHFLGLSDFLETDISYCWSEPTTSADINIPSISIMSTSALDSRELLPVMKLEEVRRRQSSSVDVELEMCTVCLCEIEDEEEIRLLENCQHYFHRCCLDGWMEHEQTTCPLCRTPFVVVPTQADIEVEYDYLWNSSELSTNQFS